MEFCDRGMKMSYSGSLKSVTEWRRIHDNFPVFAT
jgi:hypothetical protein